MQLNRLPGLIHRPSGRLPLLTVIGSWRSMTEIRNSCSLPPFDVACVSVLFLLPAADEAERQSVPAGHFQLAGAVRHLQTRTFQFTGTFPR